MAHEAKIFQIPWYKITRIFVQLPYCAAHRLCAQKILSDQATNFQFSPSISLIRDTIFKLCSSYIFSKCYRTEQICLFGTVWPLYQIGYKVLFLFVNLKSQSQTHWTFNMKQQDPPYYKSVRTKQLNVDLLQCVYTAELVEFMVNLVENQSFVIISSVVPHYVYHCKKRKKKSSNYCNSKQVAGL